MRIESWTAVLAPSENGESGAGFGPDTSFVACEEGARIAGLRKRVSTHEELGRQA